MMTAKEVPDIEATVITFAGAPVAAGSSTWVVAGTRMTVAVASACETCCGIDGATGFAGVGFGSGFGIGSAGIGATGPGAGAGAAPPLPPVAGAGTAAGGITGEMTR